jgi:hypothetical protein
MSTTEGDAMSESPTPQTPTDSSREIEADPTERASYLDGIDVELLRTPGRRTTGKVEHAVIEAELVAEGKDLDNPAIPAESIMADVLDTLERKGLEPAWKACRGDGDA